MSPCALCAREAPLTFHHLIPRTLHSNKWFRKNYSRADLMRGIDLCRPCHSAVHAFIPNKDLGRHYATLETLREHPDVQRFSSWAATQPVGRIRVRKPKNR